MRARHRHLWSDHSPLCLALLGLTLLGLPLVALGPGAARARAQGTGDAPPATLAAIDAAVSRGDISVGEATLYKLEFIHGSTNLPRTLSLGGGGLRCATDIVSQARQDLLSYSLALQGDIGSFLQRPVLNASLDTPHFRIHYNTSGGNKIFGWPNTAYRDSVAAAAERSWRFYHAIESWQVPPSDGNKGGGNNLIDIYVDDLGTSAYGYAEPEDPAPATAPNAYTAFAVIDNDYQGFGYADRTWPMKVTVAHEYHHIIQMGYTLDNRWWMENLSTFMEGEVYPGITDNYQYIGCYTTQPYLKESSANGCFEYGCFLWPAFITENWDRSLTRKIQECAATGSIFQCFDTVLGQAGSDYASALADWDVWNFYTYQRDDRHHYRNGANYRYYLAFDQEFGAYPVVGRHPSVTEMPEATGESVERFNRDVSSADNKLTIQYTGETCTRQVMVVVKGAGGAVFHEYYMNLNAGGSGSLDVPDWDQSEFAEMIVSLPLACGSGSFDYVFGAFTSKSTGVPVNPPLYTRTLRLDQNSPNPFGPETRIGYSLTASGPVDLAVFDAGGRRVRSLIHAEQAPGAYSVRWDGRSDGGLPSSPGIYFYRLEAGGSRCVRKMILSP